MKTSFVRTENYAAFSAAVKAVEQRGAQEAGLMLVYGNPGYGKSHIVSKWAEEQNAVFLRAYVDWTPKYFLTELARLLHIDARGSSQQIFERLLKIVVQEQLPIVIDEAEFTLHNKAAALEKIRDFSDRAEVTVVLIGMEKIQSRIAVYKQISSRIAQVVEFQPATLADVALACKQLCEYEVSPAMASEVYRLSNGRMREIMNIIANMERIAKANGIIGELDVSHFEGMALSHDWQSRTGKKVKKG